MNFMMFTELFLFLLLKWILFNQKFIYCSDAGLASEDNRLPNHMGQRAFIVTQSIKKLPAEDRAWTLKKTGFKRLSDDKSVGQKNGCKWLSKKTA